jgi:ribosomal protein S27E
MKQIACDHCGETVVVPQQGETVVSGETPLEHLDRTGHNYKRKPRLTACDECGFAWYYTGSADRATCPNCKAKAQPGHVPEGVDDAWVRAETKSAE